MALGDSPASIVSFHGRDAFIRDFIPWLFGEERKPKRGSLIDESSFGNGDGAPLSPPLPPPTPPPPFLSHSLIESYAFWGRSAFDCSMLTHVLSASSSLRRVLSLSLALRSSRVGAASSGNGCQGRQRNGEGVRGLAPRVHTIDIATKVHGASAAAKHIVSRSPSPSRGSPIPVLHSHGARARAL